MSRPVSAALLLVAVLGAAPATAVPDDTVPPQLAGAGITEHLDEPIPLDTRLTDELGNEVRLGDLFVDGQPVLLSFVYYRCPMLCSLVLDGMTESLRGMDWIPGENFQVINVSFDPTDTPEVARGKKASYVEAYGRPEADAGWHFLTGEEKQVRKLADAVGFGYRYLPAENEFSHAAALFVITPDGRVSRYLYGIKHDPQTVRLSLVEAADGGIGSAVDKFLLYCYRYDPEKGSYAPVAMRIMQVGAGLCALVLGAVLGVFWVRESRRRKRLA